VIDLLAERIPATVELALVALALSLGVGIPLGVRAAARRACCSRRPRRWPSSR
jgi:peptide/nickel transport system permease protein